MVRYGTAQLWVKTLFCSKCKEFYNVCKSCVTFFQFHHTRLAVILKTWFNVAPKNTYFFTGKWELFTHFPVPVQRFCAVPITVQYFAVLWIRDPVPFWPLHPGSRMGTKSISGIRIRNETIFGVKNTYRYSLMRTRNLFDSGSGIRDGKNSDPG